MRLTVSTLRSGQTRSARGVRRGTTDVYAGLELVSRYFRRIDLGGAFVECWRRSRSAATTERFGWCWW